MDQFTLKVQKALTSKGFDVGKCDGINGPKTEKAIKAFKKSLGYRATPYIGPLTEAALFEGRVDAGRKDKQSTSNVKDPLWLKLAKTYIGLREFKGSKHNKKILSWWQALGTHFKDDETPWCAGFVNGVVQEAGYQIPLKNRAAARSWEWGNTGVKLKGPCVGAIVTMWRKSRNSSSGHIGLVVGRDKFNNVMVLGGNQNDAVNIRPFKQSRILSYRWASLNSPPSKVGFYDLPVIDSDGRVSTNEA